MYCVLLLLISLTAYGSCYFQMNKAAKSISEFGFSVYKELANKPGNIVFSPIAADTILALTFIGADGTTATEMQSTLHLPDKNKTIAAFSELTPKLLSNNISFQFTIANKIFMNKDVDIKSKFLQTAKNDFYVELENLNFTHAKSAADTINKWMEAMTNNKIHDLVDADYVKNAFMVLASGAYVCGEWFVPFHSDEKKMQFHINEKESVEVPSMTILDGFLYSYIKYFNADVVEIPYSNRKFAMVIVLPRDAKSLKQIEAELESYTLRELVKRLSVEYVSITMPKFKIEYEIDLKNILQSLGMKKAFTTQANFKDITYNSILISNVKQKAFIDVNEKGTEGAASRLVMENTIPVGKAPKKYSFVADKPFSFFIYQLSTKTMLFVGSVTKP